MRELSLILSEVTYMMLKKPILEDRFQMETIHIFGSGKNRKTKKKMRETNQNDNFFLTLGNILFLGVFIFPLSLLLQD